MLRKAVPKLSTELLVKFAGPKSLGYVSDLHLERNKTLKPRIPVTSDYLALCGDIGNPFQKSYKELLTFVSLNFEETFLVSGNHEYDAHKTIEEVDDKINNVCEHLPNVHFLNNSSVRLGGYKVLGTTLWTSRNIASITNKSGTYTFNQSLNRKINDVHQKQLEWLENQIMKDQDTPKIVLTHHPPSFKMCIDKFEDSPTKSLFYNNLDHLMAPHRNVYAWLCGHSHCVFSRQINYTYCAINAHGYKVLGEVGDKVHMESIYL